MSKNDPQSLAELDRWGDTIATMRECDDAAGITDKGTTAATEALGRAVRAHGGKS